MAGNVTKDFFSIGGPYQAAGGGTVGTYTVPKGAKAVIISAVLNTVGTAISATQTQLTLTASGGQTGILVAMGAGGAAVPGQGYAQTNGGSAISAVIDAATADVVLTLAVVGNAADECTASIVGQLIS